MGFGGAQTTGGSGGRLHRLLRATPGAAGIALASFLAFAPALHAGFVWDDDTHLTAHVVLEEDGLERVWRTTDAPAYWPVTWTSYWIEHRLWGLDPRGYHAVNLALHVVGSLLVWALMARLGVPLAWLVALLFALHPVNVETVAWITQRKNLLSLVFGGLALLGFLRLDRGGGGVGLQLLSVAAFLAAMLSKGAAAPLPAVMLGVAWWRRGRITRADVANTLPFFVVAAMASLVEIFFQYQVSIRQDVVRDDSLVARAVGAGWVFWFYLGKALLPFDLAFVYPRWSIDATRVLAWLPLLAGLASVAVAWWQRRGWGRAALFALGSYAVLLSPVLGFFDIYYMRYSLVADHYQYLALPAVVALAVAAGARLAARGPLLRGVMLVVAVAVATGFAVHSHRLTWNYADEETLWRATLTTNPDAFLAHYNLAYRLQERGDFAAAEHHYRETLRVRPEAAEAASNLGSVLEAQGRPAEAAEAYRVALAADPRHPQAHNNLATLLQAEGRREEALAHFEAALEAAPHLAGVHYNLALLLDGLQRRPEAIRHLRRAIALEPRSATARAAARHLARFEAESETETAIENPDEAPEPRTAP